MTLADWLNVLNLSNGDNAQRFTALAPIYAYYDLVSLFLLNGNFSLRTKVPRLVPRALGGKGDWPLSSAPVVDPWNGTNDLVPD